MKKYVLSFQQIDRTKIAEVGGKGANLGELARIKGIQVPDGFCVTTDAYKAVTETNAELTRLLNELSQLRADDRKRIIEISAKIRSVIESIPISKDIIKEIENNLTGFTANDAFAVRSSATAEDLP